MSRLFLSTKEIDFINDISAEIIKDVVGQKIYYYSISETKTHIDELYNEAPEKIFDNPIEINCLVLYKPEEIRTGLFGSEEMQSIEIYVQPRDLINKQIEIVEGDFFSFGINFFEAVSVVTEKIIYGMVEYDSGIKITGKKARKNQFETKILGPKDERFSDTDAVQNKFVQQRGHDFNSEGATGDVRALQKNNILEKTDKPAEVSPKGANNVGSAFYDE